MTSPSAVRVSGYDEQSEVAVDVGRWVRLAGLVLDAERVPPDAEVAVVFVDAATMTDLNGKFLGGDGPTDVLAFPLDREREHVGRHPDEGGHGPGAGADGAEPPIVLGDVVVCPDIAARQAREGGRSLDDELALLVVHGLLHLLEYDHAEPEDAARMQRRERELLAQFADAAAAPAGLVPEGDDATSGARP